MLYKIKFLVFTKWKSRVISSANYEILSAVEQTYFHRLQ
jgi:hypothetical protein